MEHLLSERGRESVRISLLALFTKGGEFQIVGGIDIPSSSSHEGSTDCSRLLRPAAMRSFHVPWRASGVCGTPLKPFACLSRVRKRANLVPTERVRARLCLKIQHR